MTTKHTPGPVFISPDQVHELNEKHGWFKFGDAQSDVSNAFANEAIARYERIRSAAPDMLAALEIADKFCGSLTSDECPDSVHIAILDAISKARGAQ